MAWFNLLITTTIMVVGVMIGVETDQFMSCQRLEMNSHRPHFEDTYEQRCEPSIGSLPIVVEISSQAIFTLEAVMKLLAFHMKYFEDPWNKLDFFSKHIPTPKP